MIVEVDYVETEVASNPSMAAEYSVAAVVAEPLFVEYASAACLKH